MGFWSELLVKTKADLLTGNWRVESYQMGGPLDQAVSYRSLTEYMDALDRVEVRAVAESRELVTRLRP